MHITLRQLEVFAEVLKSGSTTQASVRLALSQSAVDGDDVAIYFADPYRSSQRGRNENVNGLVRDFFPKGTDFKTLTKQQVQDVENILNNRSRKRYNWRSPFEHRDHVLGVV